ncbi:MULTISPECIES: hypothetical protein [unclassified Mesorhizobium]|uniref:hypothetical protein n=1 Tax=unclassified Mesorhizobium TaxID=325217 RepID=UPI000FC9A744|nr:MULTISPECIES: hypothetical protein [unclassified Mesorhizobium]RUV92414.1 hypothetical protein EOA49_31215 [Mesorhizobium sp. M1A.F.Ca.IN.020.04.1.1]RUW06400.1 hypothetical protein EOA53_23490 [Mesorhizobium sp. M1A.F.Ca.IN.020.03.1.1]RWH25979.1 MAG: hypothetical protein EOQ76_18815 [Mesorhizobium sp.]RWH40233.1 MAG: hypothetical protein EOQ79_04305 [Mesorhizobium sp.]TIR60102.1 MAG: hypothetical protein E5X22_11280 [Mesorhizobium sp.]
MRNRLLLAALAAIAGCQSDPAAIVYKPGVDLNSTVAAIDQCKIASFKDIPQSIATDYHPGYSNPGTVQCNTIGTVVSCNTIGAVNIPGSTTTYDVNQGLRDRYVTRCLEAKGFGVKADGRLCATQSEIAQAMKDRANGQFPKCAIRAG